MDYKVIKIFMKMTKNANMGTKNVNNVFFVLVMLFNIPDTLSLELTKTLRSLSAHESGDFFIWIIRFLTLGILSSIIHILIVSFSVYLGLRGFWVGILGLSSVYRFLSRAYQDVPR